MNLMLDIAASLYEVNNFDDMQNIIPGILKRLTPHKLLSGKIGVYNEEMDEYKVYYHLYEDSPDTRDLNERVRVVNRTCKFNEIKYFSRIVADSRKKLIISDNHSRESLDIDPDQIKFPRHSMLWIPLLNKNKFLGIISFACASVGSYDEEILEILEALAKLVSIKVSDILTAEKLFLNEKKYRTLVEFADDAIVLTDLSGKVLFRNHAFYSMLGFEEGEQIKDDGIKRIHPEDSKKFKVALRSIFEKNIVREEYRIKNRIGEWVNQEAKIVLLRDSENRPEAYLSIIRDMRETKKSAELLRTSEERFQNLSSMVKEGIMIHEKGVILDANQALADLFGVSSPLEIIGKNGIKTLGFTPESRRKAYNHIKNKSEEIYDVEISTAKGNLIYIEISGKNIIYKGKEARLVYMRDITERKRAEEALALNEKRLHQIIDLVPHFIFAKNSKGQFLFGNKTVADVYGVKVEELVGKTDWEFNPSLSEVSHFREDDDLVLKSGKSIENIEEPITDSNGNIMIISTTKIPFTFSGENSPALLGVSTNITERKRTEDALRKSEKKYKDLIERTSDGVFVTDLKGNFTDVNSGACKMVGYSREELLSMNILDLATEDKEDLLQPGRENMMKGTNLLIEKKLRRKDGTLLYTEINSGLFGNDKVCSFVRDITERKKSEQEHLRLQNLESLGMLAGGIAHDFNNILSAILGRASLALRRNPDTKVKNDLIAIEKAAKNATGLTQQLLTFAKGGEPQKGVINIKKIIKDTTFFALSGSNVVPVFELKDSLNIEADPGQMAQVIQNLVINAKQSMPSGGTITIITEDDEDSNRNLFIKITIQDQGIGIPKEQINKIFDPYFTTKSSGSGLGLSVCHSIITRHKGKIFVHSEQEKGTVFTIYLPATTDDSEQIHESEQSINRKLNILIMDDEESIRDFLSNALLMMGHRVTSSKDGEESVKIFMEAKQKGDNFDLLFMDLTVRGGTGGREAVMRIREIDKDVKAIVSSGYSNNSMTNYKEAGFDGILKKPYTIEDLNNVIYEILT
jgi:PAS domain S-box-containing protein